MYYRILNGIAESAQIDVNGFDGVWAAAEEGFGEELFENLEELKSIDPKTEIAVISSRVGIKLKVKLLEQAKKENLKKKFERLGHKLNLKIKIHDNLHCITCFRP